MSLVELPGVPVSLVHLPLECTSVPGVAHVPVSLVWSMYQYHVPVAGFASRHKSFRGCCGEPPSKPRNAKQCCHKRQNEKLKRTRKGFFSHIIIPCNDPLGQTNILDIAASWSISVVANIFKNILPVLKLHLNILTPPAVKL